MYQPNKDPNANPYDQDNNQIEYQKTADDVNTTQYEPQPIKVKRNQLAGGLTFNLITVVTDGNTHPFIQTVPLICQQINITSDPGNSGMFLIGPEGNANYPILPSGTISFSKLDINQIYYGGVAGIKGYMLYSGAPEVTLQTTVMTDNIGNPVVDEAGNPVKS